MSRERIQTLAKDLSEVLAWGEAAEAANAAIVAERDAAIAQCVTLVGERDAATESLALARIDLAAKDAGIAQLNAMVHAREEDINILDAKIDQVTMRATAALLDLATANDEIERLKAELALYKPAFILGDATRQQFLGAPFTEQFPICYESEFYRSSVAKADRPKLTIDRAFVVNDTMPDWRQRYPTAPTWIADIEWANPKGRTAAEVAKILPAFEGARDFANAEGKGLKLAAYGIPDRFGNHESDEAVLAQAAIDKPILDLLDVCVLTLYPVYDDLDDARTFIRRNIAMGRRIMPGKQVIVLGWDKWHPNVGALAGTPITREWQRMFLEEIQAADGYAPWLKAGMPKPTDEPWWLETQAWGAAR